MEWFRQIDFRGDTRSRNELSVDTYVIDLLLSGDVSAALDTLRRRAVGVQAAVETKNWTLATAIQGTLSPTSLIPMEALPALLSASSHLARMSGSSRGSGRGAGRGGRGRGRGFSSSANAYSSFQQQYPYQQQQQQQQRGRPPSSRGGGQQQ